MISKECWGEAWEHSLGLATHYAVTQTGRYEFWCDYHLPCIIFVHYRSYDLPLRMQCDECWLQRMIALVFSLKARVRS